MATKLLITGINQECIDSAFKGDESENGFEFRIQMEAIKPLIPFEAEIEAGEEDLDGNPCFYDPEGTLWTAYWFITEQMDK